MVSVAFSEDDLKTTNVPYAFLLPIASLYSISLFTTLSSRAAIAKKTSDGFVSGNHKTSDEVEMMSSRTAAGRRHSLAPNVAALVHVHESRVVVRLDERDEEPEKGWRAGRDSLG